MAVPPPFQGPEEPGEQQGEMLVLPMRFVVAPDYGRFHPVSLAPAGDGSQAVDVSGVQRCRVEGLLAGAGAQLHGLLGVELVAVAEADLVQGLLERPHHVAGADLGVGDDLQAPLQVGQAAVALGDRAGHALLGDLVVGPDQRGGADGRHHGPAVVWGPAGCRLHSG